LLWTILQNKPILYGRPAGRPYLSFQQNEPNYPVNPACPQGVNPVKKPFLQNKPILYGRPAGRPYLSFQQNKPNRNTATMKIQNEPKLRKRKHAAM
jgi:hypothetical protein